MKRWVLLLLAGMLFSSAFVAGKGPQRPLQPDRPAAAGAETEAEAWPDSLRSLWLYTEAVKRHTIAGDTAQARRLLHEAIHADTAYAPAYFTLAARQLVDSPDEAVALARRAWELDTANLWYERFYSQSLLMAGRYPEALERYRRLVVSDPNDPDNFRLLAALYEQQRNPYLALSTLDSAELRFGRIPYLSAMKRRLLVATNQVDKAIEDVRISVAETPYDPENRIVLATLYGIAKKDSLALAEYDAIFAIDSTNVDALMALSDFYSDRRDYPALLGVNRRLFRLDELPVDEKIKRFERFTSDTHFYREYYPQVHQLASTLAIRYPKDRRVVELYANHLIRSGELEQALALYKLHLNDTPPRPEYYRWVIDIESYLQRPDSVDRYAGEALARFPEQADFHIARGNLYTYAGQYGEAERIYREALRRADTDSLRGAIWGLLGDNYHQQAEQAMGEGVKGTLAPARVRTAVRKAMKSCYDAYDHSLGYYADNALVLNNYAYFLSLDSVRLTEALAMAERAVALTESNPTYLDTQAWVLFKLGRAADAKRIMQQAIALDGHSSPELLVHYGDILLALDEYFLAETYWRKALDKGYEAAQIEQRLARARTAKEQAARTAPPADGRETGE